jgi:hypothetical protein
MANDRKDKGGGFALLLFIAIALTPALYILSIGPLTWLVYNAGLPKAVMMIYFPLGWLCEWSDGFADFLFWYVKMWGG